MLTNQETWRSQLPLNDIDKGIRHFLTIPFFLEFKGVIGIFGVKGVKELKELRQMLLWQY